MHSDFAKRPWLRRIVALAAAYAIVLSSLFAGIATAQTAVAGTDQGGIVLCHSADPGQTTPAGGDTGRLCDASCCIGCLMVVAALPPQSFEALVLPRTSGRTIKLVPVALLDVWPQTRSHLSQGPPFGA